MQISLATYYKSIFGLAFPKLRITIEREKIPKNKITDALQMDFLSKRDTRSLLFPERE